MIKTEMSALAEELGKRIVQKYYELIQSPEISFHEVIPMKTGVYVISEQNRVLYVGSALDLDRRLKHNLLGTMGQIAQPHTFGRKLVEKFGDKETARRYLRQNCRLRILVTENLQEARVLEQFAILLLKPEYNA
jgi:excinuclease UvrABC nuclease subunit